MHDNIFAPKHINPYDEPTPICCEDFCSNAAKIEIDGYHYCHDCGESIVKNW